MKSKCRCCKTPVSDSAKEFDPDLGFICPECSGFLRHAKSFLRKAGIEGVRKEES